MHKTMAKILALTAFLSLLSLLVIAQQTEQKKEKEEDHVCPVKANAEEVTNKKCPVTAEEVSKEARVEYKGQYVYFCCVHCIPKFNKDPESYISKMSKEDQEAIKANEKCPISDEPVDKSVFTEYKGRKVYFCCQGCLDKFKKKHS